MSVVVSKLRRLFERHPSSDGNKRNRSPRAEGCFWAQPTSETSSHHRGSMFKSLQFTSPKCAYCAAVKKSSGGHDLRKTGAPVPGPASSTLITLSKQNSNRAPQTSQPQASSSNSNNKKLSPVKSATDEDRTSACSDNSDCIIHEPNLRVTEGVEVYERGGKPRSSTACRHRTGQSTGSTVGASLDVPPTTPEGRHTKKDSVPGSPGSQSAGAKPTSLYTKQTSNPGVPTILHTTETEPASTVLPADAKIFSTKRQGKSFRVKKGQESTTVPSEDHCHSVSIPQHTLEVYPDSMNSFCVNMREKSCSMESKGRYQSVLLTDVPFYQIYNQNALNRDMAELYPHRGIGKMPDDEEVRYQPRAVPLSARRYDKSDKTAGHHDETPGKKKLTKAPVLSPIPARSLKEMEEEIPFMDESCENKEVAPMATSSSPKVANKHVKTSSPVEKKGANGLVIPDMLAGQGPGGIRWAHMPQVMHSDEFKQLNEKQIKRQEALFEIITSEASYFRSLTVLLEGYYNTPEFNTNQDTAILQRIDKHILFSNIEDIYSTSEMFLVELESRWLESPIMDDLCDIVRDFAHEHFNCFVTYLKNQHYQNNKYNELMEKPMFRDPVRRLQTKSQCPNLSLDTFLLLPMQRIMRLQLLVKAVKQRTPPQTEHERSADEALGALEKVLAACDQEKNLMHKKQRIMELCKCIDFRPYVKMVSLGDRQLMKLGELGVLSASKNGASALKRSFFHMKLPLTTVLLLDDYVLLTKKRKGSSSSSVPENETGQGTQFMVEDACLRSRVVCHCASKRQLRTILEDAPGPSPTDKADSSGSSESPPPGPYVIHLILRPNAADQCDYHLDAFDYVTMERWLDAFAAFNTDEKSFPDWVAANCTQAVVLRSYLAVEDDELDLKDGETIVILNQLPSGWSKGMTQDNRRGWFPTQRVAVIFNEEAKMKQDDVVKPTKAYNEWIKKSSLLVEEEEEEEEEESPSVKKSQEVDI